MVAERLVDLVRRIDEYKELVGPPRSYRRVGSYPRTVIEIGIADAPDATRIRLKAENDSEVDRVIPTERLAAIGAAFEGAILLYHLHSGGSRMLSHIEYAGPPADKLLNRPVINLTEEELKELDD